MRNDIPYEEAIVLAHIDRIYFETGRLPTLPQLFRLCREIKELDERTASQAIQSLLLANRIIAYRGEIVFAERAFHLSNDALRRRVLMELDRIEKLSEMNGSGWQMVDRLVRRQV